MIRAALALLVVAGSATAEDGTGGLLGREVTFGALVYDDPAAPIYLGRRHIATVSDAVEFGLGPEGVQNGYDIIPAVVDILDDRVLITYPEGVDGTFPIHAFNGYLLDFLTDCVLFRSASVDPERTTGALSAEDVRIEGARLYIDVGGADFGPGIAFAVTLDVIDCPIG